MRVDGASRALWLDDRRSVVEVLAGGLALAYFRGDDRAGNVLSANNTLADDEAALACRIVSQVRDCCPLPPDCGPEESSPFPNEGVRRDQPGAASLALTRSDSLPISVRPATFGLTRPMTLPMSLGPLAPASAIVAVMIASTSSAPSCAGM